MKVYSLSIIILTSILTISCNDQEPIIQNQEELITTVILTLNPSDNSGVKVFSFIDLDGDGGISPIITISKLKSNTVYLAEIEILNESGTTTENITDEVRAEAEDHQFFYFTMNTDLTIEYLDQDSNTNPIGINTKITTNNPGIGSLQITLKHLLDKFASGVSQGEITNAGGETDIQVEFVLEIED